MPGPVYPVDLVLAGRRCLVVGGGRVAARKVDALVAAGAVVDVVAPDVCPEIETLAAAGRLTVQRRPYRPADLAAARLVVSATGVPEVAEAVFADAEAAGVWVNTADDPARCSVMLPAVLRRGELTVAVSTGGRSPAVSSWVRDRLGAELGPEYEALLDVVAEVRRRILDAGLPTEGLDWQAALDSDILSMIRAGRITEAKERLEACLSSS
jgi:precorrin-2 dehydrogenase/sirohydrochlorin ferrochelatase